MKKEFTFNIILLVIINLLVKPLYIFGVEARVQNLVGIQEYGLYFEYFGFVLLFQFINDPGIQNWYAQYIPKNRQSISRELPDVLYLKLISASIYLLVILALAWVINYQQPLLILLLGINLVLSTFFLFLRINLSGLGYYRIDSLVSSIDKLLMIIIIGYLAWFSPYQYDFSIKNFIYGQMVAYVVACLIAGSILLRRITTWEFKFNFRKFIPIFKSSFPYLITLMIMTFYNKIDAVLLGRMLADYNYEAGVYASAYRFYDASNMVSYLFAALLLPMYASNINDLARLKELLFMGLKYIVVTATVIVMTLSFYGDILMKILLNDYTESFIVVLRLLMFSFLSVSLAYIFGALLVAADKIKSFNVVLFIGLVINLVLNLLLIPMYGAIGAAITAVITQLIVLVGQVALVKKEIKIQIPYPHALKLTLFFVLCSIPYMLLRNIKMIEWYYTLGVSILICVLLSFILKIVAISDLSILKRKNNLD